MRGFWIGLLVGGVVGAGATWAGLTKPWKGGDEELAVALPDAAVQAEPKKGKKKRRRRRRKGAGPGEPGLIELSAADRAMLWKGQAVALPPKNMDFESGGGGRALNQSEINQGVRNGADGVVRCIEKARGNAELSAKLSLEMLVGPDGRVQKRRIRAPRYLHQNGLLSCVTSATQRMRFPATGAHTVVTLPLDLD